MLGDYEDDTHFCLKCHSTIIGLDNYVNHRKEGCSKNVVDLSKSPLPSQLLPSDESFNLKADDFFSSLELQSSSKKLPPSTTAKNFSGILTRSKTTAVIQATTPQKEQEQSKSGKNVWIGGHQLKLEPGDNQSKLIKAVDNLERRKDEPSKLPVYEDSDLESEELDFEEESSDDDHDAPPRNHTGGKWKPLSPIQWQRSDWSEPSPSHTLGKWKPSPKRNSPPPSHTKGKWKPDTDFPPPTFTGSKWTPSKTKSPEVPPITHTKGKWKPDDEPKEVKQKLNIPSPNYTKGKWLPSESEKKPTKITDDSPFRKSSGTIQYWCRPCNRRLVSKIVYKRHLASHFHYKRCLKDKEFDDSSGVLTGSGLRKRNETKEEALKDTEGRKRKRRKIYIKCEVCKSKVNKTLIGKHLISHYHCRKGDNTTEVAHSMVLEYIGDIVLQSPFQCGVCRFYCNHYEEFLNHWQSEDHSTQSDSRKGYFWCSFCQHRSDTVRSMYCHLTGQQHKEVVSVINRSVPIIIRKLNPRACIDCKEKFVLNISLIKHCKQKGHSMEPLLAYINSFTCEVCQSAFRSKIALKRHKQNQHGENVFICSLCNKDFNSALEAKAHRSSLEHKSKVFPTAAKPRSCDYCDWKFMTLVELKKHLEENHKEFAPKCGTCGQTFTLPQELSVHLRKKSCEVPPVLTGDIACDKCSFSSASTSELLFHKVLHTEPLMVMAVIKGKQKPVAQYKCLLCEKFFVKTSLLGHLRMHTQERPFVCHICKKGFVRKNNWKLHVRNHDRKQVQKKKVEDEGERSFLCSTCGASFKKKFTLQQHMITHSGKMFKCPNLGCIFSGRTMAELKLHFQTHSETKRFACNVCDYKGKTNQQLKRHLTVHLAIKKFGCSKCQFSARTASHLKRHQRLHTGSKPFSCPHCSYKCNTLENLRKHVLLTYKHVGKSIFECKFCLGPQFHSNFAKDFKAHLVATHPNIFNTGREAATYIAGIYDNEEDNDAMEADAKERGGSGIIILREDPVVMPATSSDIGNPNEILPLFIVSKDETGSTDNLTETWNVVGSCDVEECGTLVDFTDNMLLEF